MDAPLPLDNPAWRFALAVYGAPGVADECLALQERYGLDVSLFLFCGWLGGRGVALDAGALAALRAGVDAWRVSVVTSLRTARQAIKAMPQMRHAEVAAFRERLKALELESERLEIAFLARWAEERWPARGDAEDRTLHNLQLVLGAAARRDDITVEAVTPMLLRTISARPRKPPAG